VPQVEASKCFAGQAIATSSDTVTTLNVPTIDIICTEINFIGNLVGS
jgi:hypothetical protein